MRDVPRISSAAMLIDSDKITWYGPQTQLKLPTACETYDAGGGCVAPGLIDCHTHTVFAGTREREFVQRLENKTYAEIAHSGGGINVTVDAVRRCSRDELVELALPRLRRMLANGVTTVEIKSGYGLTVADELKMLEATRELRKLQPIELVATYLAAHTTPPEYKDANEYLELVLNEKVMSKIRDEKLAEFCDVFCDATAFDMYQSYRVLEAGKRFGLTPKIHADQFAGMDASVLAAKVGAISADHLDKIDDAGIAAMKQSECIAVLLPGSSYFLSQPQAPARTIMNADLPVAVATNYNPGSSMIESLPLVMNIACTQMRITPIEALVAVTANAAAAVNRHTRIGAIAEGMQADLVVLDVPSPEQWVYEPGRNCVRAVFKRGKLSHSVPS
jgi:imidazolonepropionase